MRHLLKRITRSSAGETAIRGPDGRVARQSPLSYFRSLFTSALGRKRWRTSPREAPSGSPDYGAVAPATTPPADPPSRKARRFVARGAVLLVLAALAMAWSDRGADRVSATVVVPASVQRHFVGSEQPVGDASATDPGRPIYPMSVIPGGAYSVAELKAYLASDPVARQSFEAQAKRMNDPELLSHLVVKRVPKPTKMHSQLRKGAKLCWTSQPVTVAEGESAFYSDQSGGMVARARCGNVMVVTVPSGGMKVPAPSSRPVGWTTPPPPAAAVLGVGGERQVVPPPVPVQQQQQQQQAPPVSVPPQLPQVPTITIPTLPPPITPPAPTCAPPVIIPPYVPPMIPTPPPATPCPPVKIGDGGGIPWWGLVGGGLLGGFAGRTSIHVSQKQKQKQKQHQHQEQVIPEPGTMLLMTLGLGAAGAWGAHRRRKRA
ncbi:MAG: PEP-CTERM sorting domain-containing protein [Armatimonadetes bacterium]|nr:PEP-CTERM sorting domain-containing protein [Armatimonadota bacterium]